MCSLKQNDEFEESMNEVMESNLTLEGLEAVEDREYKSTRVYDADYNLYK